MRSRFAIVSIWQSITPMAESSSTPQRPPSPAKLSRTPSWVLLGFILGSVFMWLLTEPAVDFKPESNTAAIAKAPGVKPGQPGSFVEAVNALNAAAPKPVSSKPRPPAPRQLSVVEAVFEEYGKNAVWDHNRTEIALWNADRGAFADFYEVYREEGLVYFRSIPALTRPLLAVPDRPEVPLIFTETEALRRERFESMRNLVPAQSMKQEALPKPEVEAPKP